MKKHILTAAAVSLVISARAMAGFTATTTTDTVLTPGVAGQPPMVGETFTTATSGGFSSFIPDTAADPQSAGDLSSVHYTLAGAVSSVDLSTDIVDYTGTYEIYYDLAGVDTYVPGVDTSISNGTFTLAATFGAGTNNASLVGLLTQLTGPTGPYASNFSDLSEGGHPVNYTGTYLGTTPNVSGTIQGVLRQNAVVPEPASLSLLGLAGMAFVSRRRRFSAR